MHEVFPPNRSVDGPALAMDPRVPQKVTCMSHVPSQPYVTSGPTAIERALSSSDGESPCRVTFE